MPFARKNEARNTQTTPQSQHIFVGRTQELEFFEKSILRPLDYPSHNIISISGDGGIGKSTLLRRFNDLITGQEFKEYCLVAGVDEFQTTPAAIMKRFAEQLHESGYKLGEFMTELNNYEETLKKLQLEREAGREALIRKASDMAGSVVEELPVFGGLLREGAKSATDYLLKEHHTRRLLKDVERLEDPIGKLTKAFVSDLNRLLDVQVGRSKRNRRLVLFFDTFERLGLEAAPWLLDNFLKEKDINLNIVLVVAGRDLLYKAADQTSRWLEYRDDIKSFPLQFFDLEQTRLYLVQFGVTEPDEVKRIWEISGGLPFFLDLIVASPEDTTNPTRDVVKRFLKWIPEEETVKRRLVIEAALFTQPFNQDDLEAFEYVGESERAALYEWLSNLTFVRTNSAKGGCYYHDRARELFGREFYERTHKDYHNTRRAIVAYYQKQLESLEKDGGEEVFKSSEWMETIKLLIEQLFLLPDETSHVKAMQYTLTLNSKTIAKQETISLLQQVIQESSNNRVNNGAILLANLLVQYFERDYRDTEFLLVIKQLIAKVKTASFFPSEQTAKLYVSKGEAYQLQGNYTQAILDFDQAISLNPKDAWAFAERGEAYRLQGNYTQAIADFDQAISLDPKNDWAFAHRGLAYRQQGNYPQAIADFDRAISLDPKYVWAFAHRGEAYRLQKKYTEAIADFDQAISLDPKDARNFAWRGQVYGLQGNYPQAIADFDQAISLNPKDDWNFASRGAAYLPKVSPK